MAFELYGASRFESSVRTRFITLVIAVESLLEPRWRNEKEVELIDVLMDMASNYDIAEEGKDSLLKVMQFLKKDSISRTARLFVDKHLGDKKYNNKKAQKFFQDCYSIRSSLVHNGKIPRDYGNIDYLVGHLDKLVSDLLIYSIGVDKKKED